MKTYTAIVETSFQHQGAVIKSGMKLDMTKEDLTEEIAKGKKKTGKYMSGVLNYCAFDDETADLIFEIENSKPVPKEPAKAKEPTAVDIEKEIASIRAEFDAMGKAYHHKWGLPRLKDELIKAKKETGK